MAISFILASLNRSRNYFPGMQKYLKLRLSLFSFLFRGIALAPKEAGADFSGKFHFRGKVFFIFLSLFLTSVAYSQTSLINESSDTLIRESVSEQTIAAIRLDQLTFTKPADRIVNCGITGNEFHFIILKLSSPVELPGQYLSIDNTSLDTVLIYSLGPGRSPVKLYEGGRLIPWQKERSFIWHTVTLDIGPAPSFILIAVKAAQKNINLNYDLSDTATFINTYTAYNRIIFFYIGIAFMVSAIILLALFLFKKRVFAIYFGYMICISFWIIDHYGILYPNFYPGYPILNNLIKPLCSLGAAFLLLNTQSSIFGPYIQMNSLLLKIVTLLKQYLLILLSLMLLLAIPSLSSLIKTVLIVLYYSGLLMAIALVAFIPLHFIKTSKVAKIFSFAMLAICLTTLEQILANAGFIKYRFMNEHGMALGSLVENSIMAFGLLFGILIERRERNMLVLALQKEQEEMLKKLLNVQYNERKRIAADLHDNIGPLLAALKINFRRIIQMNNGESQSELIGKTESIIDDSISEIRNIAHNLMPKGLASKGLINTLEEYFENVQQLYGKKLVFIHEVHSVFKPEIQINIYFIITELVLNAAKHSHANEINVCVKTVDKTVIVKIMDNGQGFETLQGSGNHSLGLQSAESRTLYLKGKFSLVSQNGNGTLVDISIPL